MDNYGLSLNGFATAFLLVNAVALLVLPRRLAALPLLVGACYMTLRQGVELGSLHFPVIRILIALGLFRAILRRERLPGGLNALDWLMVVWALWALVSAAFHQDPSAEIKNRLGLVYNACGIYYLVRAFTQSPDDLVGLCTFTAVLLAPLAIEMLYEKVALHNLFSVFGGVSAIPPIRKGVVRAQGPFAHPILAGTVGAVCFPLMIGLWRLHRKQAVMGIAACLTMVLASGSSGPIMSALAAIVALSMWHWRHRMRVVRWLAVLGYIGLDLVMKAPAYYLLARIDITGGSTGWHRARLIQSAFEHLHEWWLVGTDYTRDWMPYGVPWSAAQGDITNQYLDMGAAGGLLLMLLFIAILVMGFSFVGRALRQAADQTLEFRFMLWALGASLFAHAATFISISYFDQSVVFLYLTLGAIASARSAVHTGQPSEAPTASHSGLHQD
jgi:hypothetical protein